MLLLEFVSNPGRVAVGLLQRRCRNVFGVRVIDNVPPGRIPGQKDGILDKSAVSDGKV